MAEQNKKMPKTTKNHAAKNAANQPPRRGAKEKSKPNRGYNTGRRTQRPTSVPSLPIHYTALGGLDEIGKNMAVFEYGDDAFIIDCGMSFPDEDLLGVDVVLPDFSYAVKIKDKIRGIFITHGHEDHIGALPYLLKEMNIPVYAAELTIALIDSKLKEHGLS